MEKVFKKAVRNSSFFEFEEVERKNEIFLPDLIFEIEDKKVLVEIKTISYLSELSRSIFEVVGYLTLTDVKYDLVLLIIPKKLASKNELQTLLSKVNIVYFDRFGVLGYEILDSTVIFEQIFGNIFFFPKTFSSTIDESIYIKKKVVSITSPKSMRIIKYLLQSDKTRQSQISSETNVSIGQVNKIVTNLKERNILMYKGKHLVLIDPWKLLNDLSWYRSMNKLKVMELPVSPRIKGIDNLEEKIVSILNNSKIEYALTLFSATKKYSSYMKKYDVVQMYVDTQPDILKNLFSVIVQEKASDMNVEVYQADSKDIFVDSVNIDGYKTCSKIQTVIDLVCFGPAGKEAAIELYADLRGKEV